MCVFRHARHKSTLKIIKLYEHEKTLISTLPLFLLAAAATSLPSCKKDKPEKKNNTEEPNTPEEPTPVVADGQCGESLTWSLRDGVLTITGDGAIPDYADSDAGRSPWYVYRAAIKKVIMEDGVTGIGKYAFHLCYTLTDVTAPTSILSIGQHSFYECRSLTNFALPNGVKNIDHAAFLFCDGLVSVTIPESVTTISDMAIISCTALTTIDVVSGNPNYASVNGVLFNSAKTTLVKYPDAKQSSYTIPSDVKEIGNYAFHVCYALTNIIIPESVTTIGHAAFTFCRFTSVTTPANVTYIGGYAFSCDELKNVTIMAVTPPVLAEYDHFRGASKTLYVPKGCVNAYKADAKWNAAFTTIVEQQ